MIDKKKSILDGHRPLSPDLVRNLEEWFRIELTYTSNAIEGNTLTRNETALVVEKGLTVGGKSLTEHLEATNHAHAIDWVRSQIAREPEELTQRDIRDIHALVLKGIDDANAGRYRNIAVRISGSTVILPNPLKVPELMEEFAEWLRKPAEIHPVEIAAEAHYRLVTIHPFVDGNGRTARLLMNLILMMRGYPAAIIQKRERLAYINALEGAQLGGSKSAFLRLIAKSVERSLDIYLDAVTGSTTAEAETDSLMKIGELATRAGVRTSTIRHWTQQGLLNIADVTSAGYQLYDPQMLERIKRIHDLKEKRYTLEEIKDALDRVRSKNSAE